MAKSIRDEIKEKAETVDSDIMPFLNMIADNTLDDKNRKDTKNEAIRSLFDEGFEIHDPTGTKKIGSKVLQQAMWRVMSKWKFLSCSLHCTGKDENTERIGTEGLYTVMERGGLGEAMRGKAGCAFNAFLYGDGFLFFGKGENDENPVNYRVLRNEDVYFDTFATGIRGNRPTNKLAVVYQFDKEEAYEMWPELEEAGVYGRIPGTFQSQDRQADKENEDCVEVCWGWNRMAKRYLIFAGTSCFKIDSYTDEEYSFIKNNKPYIPVFQFLCQPSADQPFNHGLGEMLYDLAVITRKLMNLEVGHLEENVYPITLINAPQNKVDELVEKMAMAYEARAKGGKPFVAMEFSPTGGQQSVGSQALLTQNLFNEWNVVWDRLYKEFSRLGINLDDIERGSGITRGQVIAEEEAGNAFVKQMGEYNGDTYKELIECSIDAVTEFVSPKNKTPLNLMTSIMLDDGTEVKPKIDLTMGMLSKTFKDGNWFVVTDLRSGYIPSDLTKMIHEERLLSMTPPGTPEYNRLYRQIAMRMGSDMKLSTPEAPQAPQGAPTEQTPAETQRKLPAMVGSVNTPV
jgi:hypothetical protein